MLGTITLIIALSAQIGFLIFQFATNNRRTREKHIMRIAAFAVFALLLLTHVYWWGFRWIGLFLLLAISAMIGVVSILRKPKTEKKFKRLPAILTSLNACILLTFLILPGILFPQFHPVEPTGAYAVETKSVTLTDTSRANPYAATGEARKLTIQFWYPNTGEGKDAFPLVVFSHGSFGYRGSNLSTFENLASNGYVVCSIDHTYHAFFSKHTDSSTTLVNMEFMNDAVNITNNAYDEQKTYAKTHEWLALRTGDMDFVLDQIRTNPDGQIPADVASRMDLSRIGLFGHSLGGAAAAQLGRERSDVNAVIVIDGTMIGEEIGYENGKSVLETKPYPVPLLNLYNDSHYADAQQAGTAYNNISASTNAIEAYDIVIRGSGHLNFTDLPLFSPALAHMLGTGEADSRYCIETMNRVVLEFFHYTLKDTGALDLQTEY